MEIVLKLYTYVDGVNDTPFPNAEEQAMFTFTYEANRMAGSPTITATVKHRLCLDDLWTDNVYAMFNGVRYYIMNTPSSSKDNEDARYEHDLELMSEREILNHVYFIDAVQGDSSVDQPKSNTATVQFFGDVNEFAGRLNACFQYQKLNYTAVVDEGVESEDKQVSFEDKYILEALQEIYNVYEIPYYFVGNVVHIGHSENTVTYPLKYGFDEALLSISKDNANYALINKIKGQGSSDNIPYYYPNNSPKGDIGIRIISGSMVVSNFIIYDYEKFASSMSTTDTCTVRQVTGESGVISFVWSMNGKDIELSDIGIRLAYGAVPKAGSSFGQSIESYITPSDRLMPSIYRETKGAEQFYEAKNNTYEDGGGGYYEFENEYSEKNPRQGTTDFEDIKPTIKEMTNASGQRIDMFTAFAYDLNDNDETDEDGNYIHPYFFAKLRKFDGENGFNLFDQAIEGQTMTISFTSGACGACSFEIGVGEETEKNIVQVDDNGNLKRDSNGNVLWEDQTPQDRQNDTSKYEVWIALKKDDSTYSYIMPNVTQNIKPSTDDTFVILGINLPTAYITAAEKRLEQSLIKYMWMNNTEKFTFSIKFSRIFFTEHPEVLEQLNENSRVLVEYNGQQHTLYVDSFTYRTDESSPLPEITVDLVDTLSIGQNSLQTQLDSVKQDILSSVGGGDFLKQGLKYFLRKDIADTAQKKITFKEGIDIGAFESDISGGTFRKMQDGSSYAEVDKLKVRVKAYFETLEIQNVNAVGGKQIITAGGGVYVTEVVDRETVDGQEVVWDYYRCYFLAQQDGREIENRFHVGDLAISQNFNVKEGVSSDISNHYYWREVVGIGDDYIDLSKSICDTGSDEPAVEDVVCHLGNRTDVDRQGAIVFSAVDEFSPSIALYQGIDDFSYVEKDYISYGLDKTTGKSFFRVYGEMYVGDREGDSYIKYTQDSGVEIKGKLVTKNGKDVDEMFNTFQDQIDGVKETFYGEYSPTLENYPANEWTTEEIKKRHEGDVFTNIQEYVDDETTPDAGKSWRWAKNEETGEWYWLQIADSDIANAYREAAEANKASQEAKEQVTNLNTTVDGLQNFTDESFKDGIVDRSESAAIASYIKNIESIQNSVTESYSKVYNNELLEGTDKTNLYNSYTSFNSAVNELVGAIEGAIADGLVDTLEKASVDGKYDTFNTKYGDFIAYINAANKYIQDKINANALDALDRIGEMSYITDALKQYTTIEGGLIQSSLLALGYTDSEGFKVMSGTNGIYQSDKLGGGIASWWGGGMYDRFEYTDSNMPSNVAKGLVRFDGTGYFANGNLWWEDDGTLHADPLSFFVGEETVGDVLGMFQFVKSGDDVQYVIPKYPFQKLEIANDLRIGKAYLKWDEANNALYVEKSDGTSCNFYSTGGISVYGEGSSSSGGCGVIVIDNLTSTLTDAALSANQGRILKDLIDSKVSNWGKLEGKPTTIAGYGITASDVLSTLKTVDGNNSGLDADTLDGVQGERYLKQYSNNTPSGTGNIKFSEIDNIGNSENSWNNPIVCSLKLQNWNNALCINIGGIVNDRNANIQVGHSDLPYAGSTGNLYLNKFGGSVYIGTTLAATINSNVASATKLQTARTIWGQSFDGTANITGSLTSVTDITGTGTFTGANIKATDSIYVNGIQLHKTAEGVITLEGNLAVTGTGNIKFSEIDNIGNSENSWNNPIVCSLKLQNWNNALCINIGGIVNDRNANIQVGHSDLPYAGSTGNLYLNKFGGSVYIGTTLAATINSNVASATKLQTARNLWGQSFDGTKDVTGSMTVNGNITIANGSSSTLTLGDSNAYIRQQNISDLNGYGLYLYGSSGTRIANKLVVDSTTYIKSSLVVKGSSVNITGVGNNGGFALIPGHVSRECLRIDCLDSSGKWITNGIIILSNGYIGIGTDTPSQKLHVIGNILATGGGTFYSSDIRAKTIIKRPKLSLNSIANAPVIKFKWNGYNNLKDDNKLHIGGIAQYIEKILPECVIGQKDDFLSFDYATVGYIFSVQTARHLQSYETKTDREIRKLKKRIVYLESKLKKLGYEEVDTLVD